MLSPKTDYPSYKTNLNWFFDRFLAVLLGRFTQWISTGHSYLSQRAVSVQIVGQIPQPHLGFHPDQTNHPYDQTPRSLRLDSKDMFANCGPYKVVTNMAVMGYDEETKRMRVESIHPGFTFNEVQENCGFGLLKAPEIAQTPPPTVKELEVLRSEVDPMRYIIGR